MFVGVCTGGGVVVKVEVAVVSCVVDACCAVGLGSYMAACIAAMSGSQTSTVGPWPVVLAVAVLCEGWGVGGCLYLGEGCGGCG